MKIKTNQRGTAHYSQIHFRKN